LLEVFNEDEKVENSGKFQKYMFESPGLFSEKTIA
jgi:hypothetical protein